MKNNFTKEIKKFTNLSIKFVGPPRTGKTYNTINNALDGINDDPVEKLDWSNRKV